MDEVQIRIIRIKMTDGTVHVVRGTPAVLWGIYTEIAKTEEKFITIYTPARSVLHINLDHVQEIEVEYKEETTNERTENIH